MDLVIYILIAETNFPCYPGVFVCPPSPLWPWKHILTDAAACVCFHYGNTFSISP